MRLAVEISHLPMVNLLLKKGGDVVTSQSVGNSHGTAFSCSPDSIFLMHYLQNRTEQKKQKKKLTKDNKQNKTKQNKTKQYGLMLVNPMWASLYCCPSGY